MQPRAAGVGFYLHFAKSDIAHTTSEVVLTTSDVVQTKSYVVFPYSDMIVGILIVNCQKYA